MAPSRIPGQGRPLIWKGDRHDRDPRYSDVLPLLLWDRDVLAMGNGSEDSSKSGSESTEALEVRFDKDWWATRREGLVVPFS